MFDITFANPWLLALVVLVPIPALIHLMRQGWASLRFSSVGLLSQLKWSWRQYLVHTPLLLRSLALVILIVALARPQKGTQRVIDPSEGIAIEMLVDRSSSMREEMAFQGETLNRLEVVKRVFKEFAVGNDDDLKGRPNDLLGIVTFARYADTVCPLTLTHDVLPKFIESVQLVKRRNEDGTAIGDAIALAAARLKTAEETLAKQTDKKAFKIKSKIMIVLTDGQQTAGKRHPVDAAGIAKKWGIKIYTIGVGGRQRRPRGVFDMLSMRGGVDEETLKQVASETGGRFFMAEDEESLRAIYQEIDKLERSKVESIRFVDYKESFLPLAALALGILGLEILLSNTVLRRTP